MHAGHTQIEKGYDNSSGSFFIFHYKIKAIFTLIEAIGQQRISSEHKEFIWLKITVQKTPCQWFEIILSWKQSKKSILISEQRTKKQTDT